MAAVASAIVVSACSGQAEEIEEQSVKQIDVRTAEARVMPVPSLLTATGELKAVRSSDLTANAAGMVLETSFERGRLVEKGAKLIRLDTRAAVIGRAEARAGLESARIRADLEDAECARTEHLFEQGAISREEWERKKSVCEVSRAAVRAAKARVRSATRAVVDGTVRAPFSGVIGECLVSVGEYVQPFTRVASLVDIDSLHLVLAVDESDAGRLEPGQRVSFRVQAFRDERFEGVIRNVDHTVRPDTRAIVSEVLVENADHRLRPGMFAVADIHVGDEDAVTVPGSALVGDQSSKRLFVVVDGFAQERLVQAGIEKDGIVAIRDGVEPGDLVVVDPGGDMADGAPVR